MQPFDSITTPVLPQPSFVPTDAELQQAKNFKPENEHPESQSQTKYTDSQQTDYPFSAQRLSQNYPQNYQPPYPNQAYQQQPGGYPNYQGQSQYAMYNQGANQAQDIQKQIMIQQLTRNIKASGKGLVALYSAFVALASLAVAYIFANQTSYQVLMNVFQKIAGRSVHPADAFSSDTCQAFLGDIITVPLFLFLFAAFNLLSMCVAFTGLACCMFIQPLAALGWTGFAVFVLQQKCVGHSILTTMFGAENIPQNPWPYYAAMAGASLLSCFLNWSWSSNKDKAERDQRSLSLLMAAS